MKTIHRREVKFYIPENLKKYFYSWLISKIGITKSYPKRIINSLYYDSVDYKSAKDNIIGLSDRKKYRFRWYGSNQDTLVNFEIKSKDNIFSQKETFKLNLKLEDINFTKLFDLNSIIFVDLPHDLKKKIIGIKLFPILNVKYDREYFKYHHLDLTIDNNLSFFRFDEKKNTINKNHVIFEIKYNYKFQNEVKTLLRDCKLSISRNSKYLQGLNCINKFNYI